MEAFLDATYHTNESRVQKLEMAYMTDHYLQALTIHSIWPQSIGIFTAMETLKTAFYNRNTHLETHTEQGRRHSYRRLLATMFDVLCVNYRPEELQEFIGTRNKLIHEGTAVPANTPLSEYDEKSEAAWQQVGKAVNLFERALLAFLNYHGPCELFDEGFSSVS
jgi:hypothetical protein